MNDDATFVGIGRPPTNRRQVGVKLLWIGIWLAFMSAPVKDLLDGNHTPWATALGTLGLVVFVGTYLVLVFRHTSKRDAAATATASPTGPPPPTGGTVPGQPVPAEPTGDQSFTSRPSTMPMPMP
ncbi:hypothetical protein ACWD3Z_47210 [Streptomyces sp. NPDC002740]